MTTYDRSMAGVILMVILGAALHVAAIHLDSWAFCAAGIVANLLCAALMVKAVRTA